MTQETNKNTAQAIGKSLKTSPQKANLVLSMIRGKKAEDALNLLTFSRKRISEQVSKILKSTISNAENNHQLDIDKLYVKEASVGKSMVLKRFRPRARGRSGKILKPFSRVRILVAEKIEEKVQEKVKENDKKKNIDKQPNEEKSNGTKN